MSYIIESSINTIDKAYRYKNVINYHHMNLLKNLLDFNEKAFCDFNVIYPVSLPIYEHVIKEDISIGPYPFSITVLVCNISNKSVLFIQVKKRINKYSMVKVI